MTTTDLPPAPLGSLDTELIAFIDHSCEGEANRSTRTRALAEFPEKAVRYLAPAGSKTSATTGMVLDTKKRLRYLRRLEQLVR